MRVVGAGVRVVDCDYLVACNEGGCEEVPDMVYDALLLGFDLQVLDGDGIVTCASSSCTHLMARSTLTAWEMPRGLMIPVPSLMSDEIF
jgi:hypothetical protein